MVTGRRVLAGALLVLAAAGPALAGHQKDPQKHLDRMTKKLELTDEQRSQVEQIMTEYRGRMEELHSQMDALRKEKHGKISAVLTPAQQEKFEKMTQGKGVLGWFRKRKHEG
jgi:Spy/CpxP family protein refolding chaperone